MKTIFVNFSGGQQAAFTLADTLNPDVIIQRWINLRTQDPDDPNEDDGILVYTLNEDIPTWISIDLCVCDSIVITDGGFTHKPDNLEAIIEAGLGIGGIPEP